MWAESLEGAVQPTGAHTPGPSTLPRMRTGLCSQLECQWVGSLRPAPELGISTVLLQRPVAGVFLLGQPEGRASEREALPPASQFLCRV